MKTLKKISYFEGWKNFHQVEREGIFNFKNNIIDVANQNLGAGAPWPQKNDKFLILDRDEYKILKIWELRKIQRKLGIKYFCNFFFFCRDCSLIMESQDSDSLNHCPNSKFWSGFNDPKKDYVQLLYTGFETGGRIKLKHREILRKFDKWGRYVFAKVLWVTTPTPLKIALNLKFGIFTYHVVQLLTTPKHLSISCLSYFHL